MLQHKWFWPTIIGLATFITYSFWLSHLPLTDPVETNYALTAKEMFLQHEWISPIIYGQYWYDKPIFTYWLIILAYKAFGITDFAARLPGVMSSVLSTVAMYFVGSSIFKHRNYGIVASCITATMLEFWYIGHAVVTDMHLFLFSIAIFFGSYQAVATGERKYRWLAYGGAGLAVLTKGPVGIVLPGMALLIWYLYTWCTGKSTHSILRLILSPTGIGLFLFIILPWYGTMCAIHGSAFIDGFLGLHNVGRATVSEHPKFDVWYYYLLLTPVLLLPWTPLAIKGFIQQPTSPFKTWSWCWAGVVFVFYTLVATKYITYTFIMLIPLILCASYALIALGESWYRSYYIWIPLEFFCVALIVGAYVTPILSAWSLVLLWAMSHLAVLVSKRLAPAILLCTIYVGVTITVPPILTASSGLPVAPYITNNTYIYGQYFTSLPYYTDYVPTLVTTVSDDDPLWTKGKNIMPTITKEVFTKKINSPSEPMTVIVPNKYKDDFAHIQPRTAQAIVHTAIGTVWQIQ